MDSSLLLASLLGTSLLQATPLLFPTIGEIYAELSGVIIIGLEGIMLVGASTAYLYSIFTNNLYGAIFVGVAASLCVGILIAFFSVTLKANQVVLGIGIILLGESVSSYVVSSFSKGLPNYQTATLPSLSFMNSIPIIGPLFSQNALVYVAIIVAIVSWRILYHSKLGLKIRMIGEDPKSSDYMGLSVTKYRYLCIMICAGLAALGGVFMVLGTTGVWVDNITAGRGFIALALVRMSSWKTLRALVFSLFLGLLVAVQYELQLLGSPAPPQLLQAIPYIAGIAILFASTRFGLSSQPKSLGKPYSRS
jgi:general nucleoside transport system permease protein